jgi:hypothetical protein
MAKLTKAQAQRTAFQDERVDAIMSAGLGALETRQTFATEITMHWKAARERFIVIGEALYLAKQRLEHGEFEEMVRSDLPFDRNVCHQLRRVYEAVATKRLSLQEVPDSYSTAYKVTTLSDKELEQARGINLLRPELTRSEIMRFKKSLQATPPCPSRMRIRQLIESRRKLLDQLRRLEREMEDLGIDPQNPDFDDDGRDGGSVMVEGEAVEV